MYSFTMIIVIMGYNKFASSNVIGLGCWCTIVLLVEIPGTVNKFV